MAKKKKDMGLSERKIELTKLIADAEEMKFDVLLIANYKRQLADVQTQLNKRKEKNGN